MNQEFRAKDRAKMNPDEFEEALKRLRPDLPMRLETALRMGRKARHHVLESIRHMQDGGELDAVQHLEEALMRLNDQSYEVVNVMSLIECFYIQNEQGGLESPGLIGIPLKKN
jgi:hypothetical protein